MNTFFLIVLGQIVSLFGNAALRFALPLYLLRQTGSAALYGGITALAMLPALAGMLTGGALADRCRKARLMALLDLVTTGIAAAAAAGLPHLPLLPLVLTVLGSLYAIQGLYQPVVRACLPLLLNGTQLLRGNAVIQLVIPWTSFSAPCWVLFCWSISASGVCWCSAAAALHFLPGWSSVCASHRMSHRTQGSPSVLCVPTCRKVRSSSPDRLQCCG